MKRRKFVSISGLAVAAAGCVGTDRKVSANTAHLIEPQKKIKVVGEFDVCVLGGSCTGVFAAVRAAQSGAKVAIVEKQNAFGGVATSGLVSVWHKFSSNKSKKQIIGGLTELMVQRLEKLGGVSRRSSHGYNLNTEELKIELDRLVLEHKITPFLHTYYAAPLLDGNLVKGVFIENKNGRQAIKASAFVDATGDGDLAKDAGLPFEIRDGLQPPTTCAEISGLPKSIMSLIKKHREEFGLVEDNGWGAPVPGSPGVNMCAYTHVFNTDASDAAQLTAAEIEGRRQIRAYMDIARKYGEKNNKPCLLDLASCIGVRETRSFTANYTLTEEDVLSCKRFDDAIANCTYHIDVHDPKTGKFKFKEPRGDFYQIPLSCMVSDKAPNVVLAGRMISTDRSAFGGVRVMVNLNQTGEAAGVTAAAAAEKQTAVAKVNPKIVRERLSKLGAKII